jgi:hypothetical protein
MSVYAVNSKEPIAAWIESRDPEAVTSSKATDLIGTNHGTLTSMDLTADPDTARIADTDAGGVRALAFDGSNDYVTIPHASVLNPGSSAFSISCWIKPPNSNQYGPILQKRNADGGIGQLYALAVATSGFDATVGKKISFSLLWNSTSVVRSSHTTADVADGNWHHVVAVWNGSAIKIYVDGVDRALTSEASTGTISVGMSPSGALRLGANVPGGFHYTGRQDDLRLFFGYQLDADDIAYLYSSGSGRGRIAVTPDSRRRRQSVSGGVL